MTSGEGRIGEGEQRPDGATELAEAREQFLEDQARQRWQVAFHEAAHVVVTLALAEAGGGLPGMRVRAAIVGESGACAWVPMVGPGHRVVVAAAGPAADCLADRLGPPPTAPRAAAPGQGAGSPGEAFGDPADGEFVRSAARSVPDEHVVAQWAIAGVEKDPDRWAPRARQLIAQAEGVLRRYRKALVGAALRLWRDGALSVPGLEQLALEETDGAAELDKRLAEIWATEAEARTATRPAQAPERRKDA